MDETALREWVLDQITASVMVEIVEFNKNNSAIHALGRESAFVDVAQWMNIEYSAIGAAVRAGVDKGNQLSEGDRS